jgi:Zn-dependent peptidase ImmA (M78 family)/DNA-binding XRE family transcriptional regulator
MTQAELAATVGDLKPTSISAIEKDRLQPSESLATALAEVLDVTTSFFQGSSQQSLDRENYNFRHLQAASAKTLDQAAARASLFQQLIMHLGELARLPEINIPQIQADDNEGIENAAEVCREHWSLGAGPIDSMTRVVENAGIVVAEMRGATATCLDAVSNWGPPPIIAINTTKESASRNRFNIAHELGHLVIHRTRTTGDKETERQADRFAAALLLPRATFAADCHSRGKLNWPRIFDLKNRWKVSLAAIVHRARELQVIKEYEARSFWAYHRMQGWGKGEPNEPPKEHPETTKLAIEIASKDYNVTLATIAERLGWSAPLIQDITGLDTPSRSSSTNTRLAVIPTRGE